MPEINKPNSYDMYVWGDVGYWPVSARMAKFVASECKDKMTILVNSLGGMTAEAIAISTILKMHGNAHVHFIGASASAATILSMGAKHVSIDEDALYMVHKCSSLYDTFDYFNADQLQEHIDQLQKDKKEMEAMDSVVAGMYARRCKKSQKQLLDLMSNESWLTAKEALEWGFVDEITQYEEDKEAELSSKAVSLLREHGIKVRRSKKAGAIESIMRGLQSLFGVEDAISRQQCTQEVPAAEEDEPELARLGKEVSRLTGQIAEKEAEIDKLKKAVAKKEQDAAEKDNRIADLAGRLEDMANKPAKEAVSVVESGADKKNDKPYESVSKNTDFLISLAKKYC